MLFKPTSKKATIASNVVTITHVDVINCAPLTPTFLPKNPDTIDPNKGKVIIAKYIIYILLRCFLLRISSFTLVLDLRLSYLIYLIISYLSSPIFLFCFQK